MEDDNCDIALMSDQNTCSINKNSKNIYMYCLPQSLPNAQNYGNYILRNPQTINVGSSSNNMIVSPIPENPQGYNWSDFFQVKANNNKLYVRRTDSNLGWNQKLILNAYSTCNIKMFPQYSSSYFHMSDSKIDYYNTDNIS